MSFPGGNEPAVLSAFECQRLMREVNKFRSIAAEGWNGGPLQVLVTGRSAFASEISLSMHHDVVATLLGSVLLVGTIFFVGFRRWLPLLGMALCLLLSCLVALTLGQLLFGRLSMISVGFCAILVGLGVDFAILTIGRYHQARSDGEAHRQAIATSIAKLGRAVFFGALTTAVGFLALVLSGSMAFSELGVLIAIGIFVAGLFMCSILFLFVRERHAAVPHDWLFESVRKYVHWTVRKPMPMLVFSSVAFSGPDSDRFFAHSAASFRGERTLTATEEHSREPGARKNHALNAGALGTRIGNCASGESAGAA